MDIKALYGESAYAAYGKPSVKTAKSSKKTSGTNFAAVLAKTETKNSDRIEFSFEQLLTAAKHSAASAVDADTNLSKVEQLKDRYTERKAGVNDFAVAQSVLGLLF